MTDLASALDAVEQVQHDALDVAGERIADAIAALAPFQMNGGRILPGVERAVKEELERLEQCMGNIASIASLHFTKHATEPPTPIESAVDEAHTAKVLQAKEAA